MGVWPLPGRDKEKEEEKEEWCCLVKQLRGQPLGSRHEVRSRI